MGKKIITLEEEKTVRLALWALEHPELKEQIDKMTYEDMLRRWRFGSFGDLAFQGERGSYYAKVMAEKRASDPVALQI